MVSVDSVCKVRNLPANECKRLKIKDSLRFFQCTLTSPVSDLGDFTVLAWIYLETYGRFGSILSLLVGENSGTGKTIKQCFSTFFSICFVKEQLGGTSSYYILLYFILLNIR